MSSSGSLRSIPSEHSGGDQAVEDERCSSSQRAPTACSSLHRASASSTLHARYHDRWVRTPFGWKLAALRLEVLFTEGNLAIVR